MLVDAVILKHPPDKFTFDVGPSMPGQKRMNSVPGGAATQDAEGALSKPKEIVLECEADGWPKPQYQWYRGKEAIPGATEPRLVLSLKPKPRMVLDQSRNNAESGKDDLNQVFYKEQLRFYRCVRCKQINKEVPYVAYHVVCGNCKKPFIHGEIEPYDDGIQEIDDAILVIRAERDKLMESRTLLKAMLEGDHNLDVRERKEDEKLVNATTTVAQNLTEIDPRDDLHVKLKHKHITDSERDQLGLFEDLSNQIKERNMALLSLQQEKLALKERLDHAYRFYDEGELTFLRFFFFCF
jgi:hypothetical protein